MWTGTVVNGSNTKYANHKSVKLVGYSGPKRLPLIQNPLILTRIRESCMNCVHPADPSRVSGSNLQFAGTGPSWVSKVGKQEEVTFEQCRYKLYDKMDTFRTNLAEFIATRQQTANMISEKVMGIYRIARDVRRGNVRQLKKKYGKKPTSKDAAGRFLEYSFGWVPLVGDIYMLAQEIHPAPPFEIIVTQTRNSEESTWSTWLGGVEFTGNVHIRTKVRMGGQYVVKQPVQKYLRDYGVTDPALVAWEAMPWSFVVDWVYPIGSFLQHRSTFDGIRRLNEFESVTTTVNWSGFTPGYGYLDGTTAGSWKRKMRNKQLNRLLKTPTPYLKNPFSLDHFWLATALLRQQFK